MHAASIDVAQDVQVVSVGSGSVAETHPPRASSVEGAQIHIAQGNLGALLLHHIGYAADWLEKNFTSETVPTSERKGWW